MTTTRTIFVLAALGIVAVALFQGCVFSSEIPEVADPNPSDDIHTIHKTMNMLIERLETDRRDNPTRYKHTVEERPTIAFVGKITGIEGARLQFHIKKKWPLFDEYAECDFISDAMLNDKRINIGSIITVQGILTEWPIGERIIKLKSCRILEFH